jgi:hypothetical protein
MVESAGSQENVKPQSWSDLRHLPEAVENSPVLQHKQVVAIGKRPFGPPLAVGLAHGRGVHIVIAYPPLDGGVVPGVGQLLVGDVGQQVLHAVGADGDLLLFAPPGLLVYFRRFLRK